MAEQKFCQYCNQKHDCQEVYRQLGNITGPSVTTKVVAAFLLPLMVFIVSLLVFERILAGLITVYRLETVLSFLLALSVTFVWVLVTRVINKQLSKNK